MTHPMQAAAKAMCDEWGYSWEHDPEDDQTVAPDGEEVTYCRPSQADFKRVTRAAISAFLDAADLDPRQSQLHAMQHGMIAALKRIAEETP